METHFRDSMMWVHTWFGIVLATLLFAIFWMGTLAVFDQEIDRWMMPMTRTTVPEQFSVDKAWAATEADKAKDWQFFVPTLRTPVGFANIVYGTYERGASARPGIKIGENKTVYLDPRTVKPLPDSGTLAGVGFIFEFHWNLTVSSSDLGVWIVGAAGAAMMMLLITGVIVHRTIFINFFTLRAKKKAGRVVLDLHNIVGVLALPFHIMITLSGLVIWFCIYFPSAWHMVYNDNHPSFYSETRARFDRKAVDMPAAKPMVSLDGLIVKAEKEWGEGKAEFVHVWHINDANSYVEIRRSYDNHVPLDPKTIYFDSQTGNLLHYDYFRPISSVQRFIAGLHFIRYQHWTLRWIYFVLGMMGCVLIGTGSLFWLEARKKRHAGGTSASIRLVEGLTVGGVTGIIVATAAFFIINRLLPLGIEGRAQWEIFCFFLVWLASFGHAFARPKMAWIEQTWAIAAGAVLAVALNWITTGDHLLKTLAEGDLPVAGMDLMLLFSAAIAVMTAQSMQRKQSTRKPARLNPREALQDA